MSTDDRELTLLDLQPERLVFRDVAYGGDGTRHEWLSVDDLGLEQIGQLRRIQDELGKAMRIMAKATSSAAEMEQAGRRLAGGLDAFLRLMLPTLPEERLRAIPLRGRQYMVEWWTARQPRPEEPTINPQSRAPVQPTRRGKRSPASSPPTGSTR